MQHKIILTGDINLMGVTDPTIPFAQIGEVTRNADVVFANLECCFYEPAAERSTEEEGFYASLKSAEALTLAGVHAVGNANNVNIGGSAIRSSVGRLDELGVAHTGAGINREDAAQPVILERDGIRYGFMQRSSVYWSHGHEATDDFPGISTVRAHTAYRPQIDQLKTLTRPGMPPEIITWADTESLTAFQDDIASLRQRADVVIASNHWGLDEEVLTYQQEIAHAAIEAGADLVLGHGPHFPLGIEVYKDKPVFYGVGSFSFETGHRARKHPDWLGLMLHASLDDGALQEVAFTFVRHNAKNETVPRDFGAEQADLEDIRKKSARFGTEIAIEDGRAIVWRKA